MKQQNTILILGFVSAVALFIGVPHKTDAQMDKSLDGSKNLTLSTPKAIKEFGWKIPAAKKLSGVKPYSKSIERIKVDFTALTPISQVVDFEDYFIISDKEVRISESKRTIDSMGTLSVKGKVFAYGITYSLDHGPDSSTGGVLAVYYLDGDGDGRFEERIMSSGLPPIPEWVKP
jgi:hypothetical protein